MLEYTSSACVAGYSPVNAEGERLERDNRRIAEEFADWRQLGSGGSHLEADGNRAMRSWEHDVITNGIEHELTVRLERASDLSERAKRANDAAQHEIDRALEIADELRDVTLGSAFARAAVARVVARSVK